MTRVISGAYSAEYGDASDFTEARKRVEVWYVRIFPAHEVVIQPICSEGSGS